MINRPLWKEENRSSSKSTFCALAPELLPLILIQIFTESLAFMQDQGWVFAKKPRQISE